MAKAKQTLDDAMGNAPAADDAPDLDTPVSQSRPAYASEGFTFGADELSTPILKIAQGLSPEVRDREAQPGDFILSGFGPEESVTLVIAGFTRARRYVPQNAQKATCWASASPPLPLIGQGEFKGRACDECPLSQWGRNEETGRNIPPACNEIDEWLCYSITHGLPVRYPLKGMAMKGSRFLKQLWNAMGPGQYAVDVTAKSVSQNGRTWQEPDFKLSPNVSAEQALKLAAIATGKPMDAALPAEGS